MMDIPNTFLIGGMSGGRLAPVIPIRWPLSAEDAALLAAWLVAMGVGRDKFLEILAEVEK